MCSSDLFDKFADDQNTGRFVIVDGFDISGGGIVSGLVASKQLIESSFTKDETTLSINCFDEYYYDLKASEVKKRRVKASQYGIGDDVPCSGESYNFKEDFDLIALNSKLIAKIRSGKLIDVIPLCKYSYEGVSVINESGFGLKLTSQQDVKMYINDSQKGVNEIFANKWLDFTKYRTIKFSDIIEEIPEYII